MRAEKVGSLIRINKILADVGTSMGSLLAEALVDHIEYVSSIERIDRLITVAENRRDDALRELDRPSSRPRRNSAPDRAGDRGRRS